MKKEYKIQSELLKKQLKMEEGLTKEEKIALNKARVAKFHPEPDFTTISPRLAKERQKIKHEKDMMERAKRIWHSIVSVPMGGINKKH